MPPTLLSNVPQRLHDEAAASIDSFHTPVSPKLRMDIEYVDGQWVAEETYTAMFGEGDTQAEAEQDLLASLMSLRQELESHSSDLAPRLKSQLKELRQVFGPEA